MRALPSMRVHVNYVESSLQRLECVVLGIFNLVPNCCILKVCHRQAYCPPFQFLAKLDTCLKRNICLFVLEQSVMNCKCVCYDGVFWLSIL
jgi:hypothetical protein